jgi:ATP synthase protein I
VAESRPQRDRQLIRRIEQREQRKLRARRQGDRSVWFGLGMYGLVGWSVAIPTVLGVALGVWVDARYPSRFSWTLMLLFGGLIVGSWTAWYWIAREQRAIGRGTGTADGEEDELP